MRGVCNKCSKQGRIYSNKVCPECHRKAKEKYRKGVNTKSYREEQIAFDKKVREWNKAHPVTDVDLLFKGLSYIGVFS